jgi:hypothetical protein
MRIKSLAEPTHAAEKGNFWISPDGHIPEFYRSYDGSSWVDIDPGELEEFGEI